MGGCPSSLLSCPPTSKENVKNSVIERRPRDGEAAATSTRTAGNTKSKKNGGSAKNYLSATTTRKAPSFSAAQQAVVTTPTRNRTGATQEVMTIEAVVEESSDDDPGSPVLADFFSSAFPEEQQPESDDEEALLRVIDAREQADEAATKAATKAAAEREERRAALAAAAAYEEEEARRRRAAAPPPRLPRPKSIIDRIKTWETTKKSPVKPPQSPPPKTRNVVVKSSPSKRPLSPSPSESAALQEKRGKTSAFLGINKGKLKESAATLLSLSSTSPAQLDGREGFNDAAPYVGPKPTLNLQRSVNDLSEADEASAAANVKALLAALGSSESSASSSQMSPLAKSSPRNSSPLVRLPSDLDESGRRRSKGRKRATSPENTYNEDLDDESRAALGAALRDAAYDDEERITVDDAAKFLNKPDTFTSIVAWLTSAPALAASPDSSSWNNNNNNNSTTNINTPMSSP